MTSTLATAIVCPSCKGSCLVLLQSIEAARSIRIVQCNRCKMKFDFAIKEQAIGSEAPRMLLFEFTPIEDCSCGDGGCFNCHPETGELFAKKEKQYAWKIDCLKLVVQPRSNRVEEQMNSEERARIMARTKAARGKRVVA